MKLEHGVSPSREYPTSVKLPVAVATAILAVSVAVAIGWANARPRRLAGFVDLKSPFAEPWSPDPRSEYGWPLTLRRVFDRPSSVNARGTWDVLGLVLDATCWLGLLLLTTVPYATYLAVRLYHRETHSAQQRNPVE